MKELFNEILNFLLNPKFEGWLLVLKIVFLIFGFFFLGFTIWGAFFTSWFRKIFWEDFVEFIKYKPFEAKIFASKWKKIKKRLISEIEAEAKLAILEADSLLDQFLAKQGYPGQTLRERLESVPEDVILNKKELKEAIKIKEAIVEDPSFRLTNQEAKKILEIYEKALKDLNAI